MFLKKWNHNETIKKSASIVSTQEKSLRLKCQVMQNLWQIGGENSTVLAQQRQKNAHHKFQDYRLDSKARFWQTKEVISRDGNE